MNEMEGSTSTSLRDSEVWADLQPIPQDDGPNPVVPIAYSAKFEEAMGLFRAIQARDERSPRALQLTSIVILLNPASYTVWHYRRLVAQALCMDLSGELDFVDGVAVENSKNYQLWHHRRWCAEKLGKDCGARELAFTEKVLKEDAKHYHAWAHRLWILRQFDLWEGELEYCAKLIQQDVHNNSAWNQRYTVMIATCHKLGGLVLMQKRELEYVKKHILLDVGNESAWRYLRGLYKGDMLSCASDASITEFCALVLEATPCCVHAMSLLLDLICCRLAAEKDGRVIGGGDEVESAEVVLERRNRHMNEGRQLCSRLQEADPLRQKYWHFKNAQLLACVQKCG